MRLIRLEKYAKEALLFARRNPGYNYAHFDKQTTTALQRLYKLGFIDIDKTAKSLRFKISEKGKRYAYENL